MKAGAEQVERREVFKALPSYTSRGANAGRFSHSALCLENCLFLLLRRGPTPKAPQQIAITNNCLSFASYLADLLLQALWLTSCRCSDFVQSYAWTYISLSSLEIGQTAKQTHANFTSCDHYVHQCFQVWRARPLCMHGQIWKSWVVKTCWVSCLACFALGPKIGRPPWGRLSAMNKSGMLHQWYGAVYVENHAPGLCICDIITFL